MVSKIKALKYNCPFCGKELESRFSKCFNVYCQGQKFNLGNLVIYKLNPDLGLGKIVKVLEIPTSKSLDDEDTRVLNKYKVSFKNNVIKDRVWPLSHFRINLQNKLPMKPRNCQIYQKNFTLRESLRRSTSSLSRNRGKVLQLHP